MIFQRPPGKILFCYSCFFVFPAKTEGVSASQYRVKQPKQSQKKIVKSLAVLHCTWEINKRASANVYIPLENHTKC